ncbi:MAG: dTDP-4-dehydrorhamnose 3,5-epimerase [Xanthobacteraceae bacterium]
MNVEPTNLSGLLLIEPRCFGDERGFFLESYHAQRYRDHGIADVFVQDNQSRSRRGVLRGLHFQVRYPQAQIVTVMRGRIFDVAVDLRPDSTSFGWWYGVELNDEGPRQLYMPPGFGHGFCVLSEFADLHYKVSQLYDHADEGGVFWNDRDIGVRWPIENPVVSRRDGAYPTLRQLNRERLPHVSSDGADVVRSADKIGNA